LQDDEDQDRRLGNVPPFFLRGGGDLAEIERYATTVWPEVRGEYNVVRNGIDLRLDHSLTTRYAIEGLPAGAAKAICRLGYTLDDFHSSLFSDPRPGCWVLSLFPDQWVAVYRHNATGALIPFFVRAENAMLNACELSDEQRQAITEDPHMLAAMETLAGEFSYVGQVPEEVCKANLHTILRAIPAGSKIFIILNKEYHGLDDVPEARAAPAVRLNHWIRQESAEFDGVTLVPIADFLRDRSDINPDNYLNRVVYYRIFKYIWKSSFTFDVTHPELQAPAPAPANPASSTRMNLRFSPRVASAIANRCAGQSVYQVDFADLLAEVTKSDETWHSAVPVESDREYSLVEFIGTYLSALFLSPPSDDIIDFASNVVRHFAAARDVDGLVALTNYIFKSLTLSPPAIGDEDFCRWCVEANFKLHVTANLAIHFIRSRGADYYQFSHQIDDFLSNTRRDKFPKRLCFVFTTESYLVDRR